MTVQDETNLINLATLTDIYNLKRGTINAWSQRGYFDEFFLYKKKHQFFYKRAEICKFVEDRIKLINKTKNIKIDGGKNTELYPETESDQNDNPTLSESKTKKEKYLANMAELEYQEKIKTLVKVKSVKKVFSIVCKITKHNLTAIPGRLAAELASMTDIKEIEERLSKEINQVLEEMANSDNGKY